MRVLVGGLNIMGLAERSGMMVKRPTQPTPRVQLLLVCAVLAWAAAFVPGAEGGSLDADGKALLAFKNALTVDTHKSTAAWLPGTDPCMWPGVACSGSGDAARVSVVSMTNWGLQGRLVPELGVMDALLDLTLNINSLQGPLPDTYGNMTSLVTLSVGHNPVGGGIPESILQLPQLATLEISNAGLYGPIPDMTGLKQLRSVDLSVNNLIGPVPEFDSAQAISQLWLFNNSLSGGIPKSLGSMTTFTSLYLNSNQLAGVIPEELSSLANILLDFSNNHLIGEVPASFWSAPQLGLSGNLGLCGPVLGSASANISNTNIGQNCKQPPFLTACASHHLMTHLPDHHTALNVWAGTCDVDGYAYSGLPGRCFREVRLASQAQAAAGCLALGGQLAEPHNSLQATIAWNVCRSINATSCWIGLKQSASQYVWLSDGSAATYTPWVPGQPSITDDGCVVVTGNNQPQFDDRLCDTGSEVATYLCQLPATVSSSGSICPAGSSAAGDGQCYTAQPFTNSGVTDARNACASLGGDLATIAGSTALAGALQACQGQHFCAIGLNDQVTEGSYVWFADPSRYSNFTNWAPGEPWPGTTAALASDCVQMWSSTSLGFWNGTALIVTTPRGSFVDVPCNNFVGSALCQIDLSPNNDYAAYMGCFQSTASDDVLPIRLSASNITPDSCISTCHEYSYSFAGVVDGNQCRCGNVISSQAQVLTDDSCTLPCEADGSVLCGGANGAITIFNVSAAKLTATTPLALSPAPPKKSSHKTRNILIGVGVALFVLVHIPLCWGFYILLKRRRESKRAQRLKLQGGMKFKGSLQPLVPGEWRLFSYSELSYATANFSAERLVGWGGFGGVYAAEFYDGTRAAVKRLELMGGQGQGEFEAELSALSAVRHPNLVSLYGCCTEQRNVLLVLEILPGGDLAARLHDRAEMPALRFDWLQRLRVAVGSAKGLAYLHNVANIVHRDIKPSNILLDLEGLPKIADFGLAKLLGEDRQVTAFTTRVAGSFGYSAPEYHETGKLDRSSDVYSFGVTLLELMTGRTPVDMARESGEQWLVLWVKAQAEKGELACVLDPRMDIPEEDKPAASEALRIGLACIAREKRERPRMVEVVRQLVELLPAADPYAQPEEYESYKGSASPSLSSVCSHPSPDNSGGFTVPTDRLSMGAAAV
eukprot:jgi/Chlat1/903/Chrsp107S01328